MFEPGEVLVTPHNSGEKVEPGTPYPVAEKFMQAAWPHGWSFWDESSVASLKYVVKYILKAEDDPAARTKFVMSKKPLIGAEWLRERARSFVEQGIAPQDPFYSFYDVRRWKSRTSRNSVPVQFRLERQGLDFFLQSFVDQWAQLRGGHPPVSPFLEEWCDKQAASTVDPEWKPDGFQRRDKLRFPWLAAPGGASVEFSEPHNSYFCVVDGKRWWWSFDQFGERAWAERIVIETEALRRRETSEDRDDPREYRLARDDRR